MKITAEYETAEYIDDTATVTVTDATCTQIFYVQMCGGVYSSQDGCWIIAGDTNEGDIDFDDFCDGKYADIREDIIVAAEKSYERKKKRKKK
jgi:hypothetical protein